MLNGMNLDGMMFCFLILFIPVEFDWFLSWKELDLLIELR